MKKRLLLILFGLGILLLAIGGVGALTTSNDYLTSSDIVSETIVERGYYYTIRDWQGNLLKGTSYEYSGSGIGMFKFRDTNNNVLLCAELGVEYVRGVTSVSETTYSGTGPACGILKSLAGVETNFRIGQLGSSASYTNTYEQDINIRLTTDDIKNYQTVDSSYAKVQRALWKYQSYTGNCYDTSGNVLSDYKVISDRQNINFTIPTNLQLTLSEDKRYYEANIDFGLSNKLNYIKDKNSYTIASPGIIEYVSNNVAKIKIPVESFVNGMSLRLDAAGKYKEYSYTSYVPNLTIYTINTYQDVATLSLGSSEGVSYKDMSASDSISLSVPSGTIEIQKSNSINNGNIEGAKFKIYINKDNKYVDATYLNGTLVGELTTDVNGKLLIDNLPYGKYKIEETGAAPGYVYDLNNHYETEITIDDKQNNYTGDNLLKITNEPIKVKISKRDVAKEEELEGAKISIYNYDIDTKEKGEKVIEFTSGKEPFEYYLEPGIYALEEVSSPDKYQKLNITFVFKVGLDGNIKLMYTYSNKNISVDNNKILIYNEVVVVPDTFDSLNAIYVTIGMALFGIGSYIVYTTIKKRKYN